MEAVLRLKTEGGAEVTALVDRLERVVRGSRQRMVRETRAAAGQEAGAYRNSVVTIERAEQLLTRAKLRELARQGEAQKKFIAQYTDAHKRATALIETEVGKRGNLSDKEKRKVHDLALAMVNEYDRAERRKTAITEQQQRTRDRILGRVVNRAGQVVSSGASTGLSVAGRLHGEIQSARQTAAGRETALNDTLIQLIPGGATASEIAGTRTSIMDRIRHDRLNPDTVIDAIGQAQSFANALGGDTAEQRRSNANATMDDVQFASNIDPNNIAGLVRVGALTRGKMGDDDRRALLRSFAGISFQGSVETDTMITEGLRGLQEAWSRGTANIADPAEASRRRLEIARDFAAQVQAAASSGVTTNVASNRTNTIPTALNNEYRQDQLGRAFAARRRSMTPAQQTAFDAAFTRDDHGKYHMNQSVRGRASDAARFFGTMFNNDAGAMRNFLGTHGGGGARQLMLTPDVNELSTYFATAVNARGQQVRQYDYVDELQRSTITPEQEREIARVRDAEESRKLNDEQNQRDKALTSNTAGLNTLSDRLAQFQAQNPIASTAAPAAGGLLATALGGKAGVVAGLGATVANSALSGATGRDLAGNRLDLSDRLTRLQNAAGGISNPWNMVQAGVDLYNASHSQRVVEALMALPDRFAAAVSANPPTITPQDAVHAATTNASRRGSE